MLTLTFNHDGSVVLAGTDGSVTIPAAALTGLIRELTAHRDALDARVRAIANVGDETTT